MTMKEVMQTDWYRMLFKYSINLTKWIEYTDEEKQSDKDKDILLEKLGISLEKLNDDNKSLFKFKNEKGLVITKVTPGSIAQIAGLSRGELIVNVNGKVIDNIKDFEAIVNNELKNGIRLLIEDSKMEHFVFLQSN